MSAALPDGEAAVGAAPLALPPNGAEATLSRGAMWGRPVLYKARVPKPYRHPQLDDRLRAERTRDEARLLAAARRAGVPVPIVYDVDGAQATLALEPIAGATLKAQLAVDAGDTALARLRALGQATARLHDAGVCHGDLTTSNVLVPEPARPTSLVLLDFGLGAFTDDDEPRGVDLHLVEEALAATRDDGTSLFAAFLDGYTSSRSAAGAMRRLDDIRERGRYR